MKAVICSDYGPLEQLSIAEIPEPELRSGCVRIQMTVASINPPDVLMPQGKYQVKPPLPFVPGVEGAGVLLQVAEDVLGLAPGDRVMTYAGQGCFAQQAVVPAARVRRVPAGMSDESASGFVLAYGTAYHALLDNGQLESGQSLVVLGASGGLGLCAIQIAKTLGASVIAVASTPEKRAKCLANGADYVIDGSCEPLTARIRELTNGRGAQVIFDIVGGAMTEPALRAIAPYGRFLIVGYASNQIPSIKANLVLLKQAQVIGVSYRLFAERTPELALDNLNTLCEMWREGKLHPQVTTRYEFAQVVQALRHVADRKAIGKVALFI